MVALYGLGDQAGFRDYFQGAMCWLHDHVVKLGASIIGLWPTERYDFEDAKATNEDNSEFCCLGIDELQQSERTEKRLNKWVDQAAQDLKEACE
ncbi:MAG: hypothetical protein AAFR02_08940 [Pseudomonadota bacterium]